MKNYVVNFILTFLFLQVAPQSFSAAQSCNQVLIRQEKTYSLKEESARLQGRVEQFAQEHQDRVRMVRKVPTHFGDTGTGANFNGSADIMVISVHGLSNEGKEALKTSVVTMMGTNSMSIPLKNSPDHLYMRFQETTYDFDYRWGMGARGQQPDGWTHSLFRNSYSVFDGSRGIDNRLKPQYGNAIGLEPIIVLSGAERDRLQKFLSHASQDVLGTLGRFDNFGALVNNGDLSKIVPPNGSGNNCTSWIMNAAIGTNGQNLVSLLGPNSPYVGYIATNPGWLLGFLLTKGYEERTPVTIMWTTEPVEQTASRVAEKGLSEWSFNPVAK